MKRASFYVILEPRHTYDGKVNDIRADRITTTRPTKLNARFVAVKLNIDVDERLFEQYLPEATVTINDKRELITPSVTIEDESEAAADETAEEPAP